MNILIKQSKRLLFGSLVLGMVLGAGKANADGIIINEVAFSESNDWIELKVVTTGDYSGYRIYEGATQIGTIPGTWATLSVGDFIVVHSEAGTTDGIKKHNAIFEAKSKSF